MLIYVTSCDGLLLYNRKYKEVVNHKSSEHLYPSLKLKQIKANMIKYMMKIKYTMYQNLSLHHFVRCEVIGIIE